MIGIITILELKIKHYIACMEQSGYCFRPYQNSEGRQRSKVKGLTSKVCNIDKNSLNTYISV
jgi:hypothetical protein